MTFREALQAAGLEQAYCNGLQALRAPERAAIECREPRTLTGSVNLDDTMRERYPTENRWDYGVGLQQNGQEVVVWIEVHPASTGEVQTVIQKLEWLKAWLRKQAPELKKRTRPANGYIWIATRSGVRISRNTPQARRLAQAGLAFPRERITLC